MKGAAMDLEAINADIDFLHDRFRSVFSEAEATQRGIELPTLEVLPGMRGKGVGSAFMRNLVGIGRRHGVPVMVTLGRDRSLAAWYRRFGFEWPAEKTVCRAHNLPMMVADAWVFTPESRRQAAAMRAAGVPDLTRSRPAGL